MHQHEPRETLIFEADPEQISRLDSTVLVQLMRLLLHAECQNAGVPLRAAHVPLQITISDGGEDGRVEWEGGASSTFFLPSRYCVFQAKAKKSLTPSVLRSELLKKVRAAEAPRKTKGAARKRKRSPKRRKASYRLNEAVTAALKKRGSYAVLTSVALVPRNVDKLKKEIVSAIRKGGGNPKRLAAIEVFDANKLAVWVNCHPSIALWLAERARRRSLAGFQSHEGWGKSADIAAAHWVDGKAPRFVAINIVVPEGERTEPQNKAWNFAQASAAVLDQLSRDQHCVRISGPSGFGKSRFAFETFNRKSGIADNVDNASVIYADHSIVGDEVPKLALEIADIQLPAILVVDECPDQVHHKLAGIVHRSGSRLRLLTIDVESRVLLAKDTLAISLEPAPKEMISEIAKAVDPAIDESGVRIIQDLSEGFPQMAVLAAKQKGKRAVIQSAEQYLHKVLWGSRPTNPQAQKALSILSLFDWVGITGRVKDQAEFIAAQLANMPADVFAEHIKSFKSRGVVIYRGDFVQVQPIPLAARLGIAQLAAMSDGKLGEVFNRAPATLKDSVLKRIRWLDTAPEAKTFAESLLAPQAVGNLTALNSNTGSEILDRLVHVVPDKAMSTIDAVFGTLTIDELSGVTEGRRHLVWALEKLAFRKATFERAARLMRRLAAAETEDHISNNATGEFKGFYRLHLSGTEADPQARLRILDEGLTSSNAREQELCIDALDEMLETGHFSRGSGAEEIGSAEPLKDWHPKTYGDIRGFYRAAISRLSALALGTGPFSGKAKIILGRRIRGMLNQFEVDEIKAFVDPVVQRDGFWPEAVQELNEWLYFDGATAPADIKQKARAYFDKLMPSDPVDLAGLYCHGWQTDFHDPDATYSKTQNGKPDFDYTIRKSVELAELIAQDTTLIDRALDKFVANDAKTPFAFARRLAERVPDALALFRSALAKAEAQTQPANLNVFGGMIAGADSRDPTIARECVRSALASVKLKPHAISMIGSNKLQREDLKLVASLLKSGDVTPLQCAPLSYGRGFDHLPSKDILPLLDELTRRGAAGQWAVLDMILMYLHPKKEPDRILEKKLKSILLSPKPFDGVNRRTMDGYHLQEAVALLAKHNRLDSRFAGRLTRRLLQLVKVDQSDVFYELDGPVREIIKTLIPLYPEEVGNEIFQRLATNKPLEQHYLETLLGAEHRDDNFTSRMLHALPAKLYLDWARDEPDKRAHHVAAWLPVAIKNDDGALSWHPELEAFVDEFGTHKKVLGTIAQRMHPSTWWGSLVPFLEPWLPLLRQWQNHHKSEVREWAQNMVEHLEKSIASEKKRNEEDPVGFD